MKQASYIFLFLLLVLSSAPGSEANTIRYAVFPAPPYMIGAEEEKSDLSGIDVDIVRELAKRGGYRIHFIRAPWKRVLELMKNGEADLVSSAYLTPDRKKFMFYFDRPYLNYLPIAFYYRRGAGIEVQKYTDLYRYSDIGVLRGASYFKRFDSDQAIKRVEVSTQEQLYPMLIYNRISLMAGYIPTENYFIMKYGYTELLERSQFVYNLQSNVYMAISRKSSIINDYYRLNSINTSLHNDGFIKRTINLYYNRFNPSSGMKQMKD